MSKYKRLALSKAFAAAKEYLAKPGEYRYCMKQEFICHALLAARWSGQITEAVQELAISVVINRIDNQRTVQGWLCAEGYLPRDLSLQETFDLCQEYRHRWLDALIKEFSDKPD